MWKPNNTREFIWKTQSLNKYKVQQAENVKIIYSYGYCAVYLCTYFVNNINNLSFMLLLLRDNVCNQVIFSRIDEVDLIRKYFPLRSSSVCLILGNLNHWQKKRRRRRDEIKRRRKTLLSHFLKRKAVDVFPSSTIT